MWGYICLAIAGLCFTVIIPTVVTMMWATIDRQLGWTIIAVSVISGCLFGILGLRFARTPPSFGSEQARVVADRLSRLSADAVSWLRQMLSGARPVRIPDASWQELERTGLVERDHTGPRGIVPGFGPHIRRWLWFNTEGGRRKVVAGFLMAAGIVLFVSGLVLYNNPFDDFGGGSTEPSPPTTPQEPPNAEGAWRGDRFIYDVPKHVFTVAVTPKDDERFYRIAVPDATPEAFAGFKIEYEGGLAIAAIVPHQRQQVGWERVTRDTRYSIRLGNDKTTVLKVHVPNNSDVTTIRAYVSWWGIRNAAVEEPMVPELGPRLLTAAQKAAITETLRSSDWQPDTVWIRYASGCEECRRYALDFKSALTLAGWNGDFGKTLDEPEDLIGLKLHVADMAAKPQSAALLAVGLERASVNFDWSPWSGLEKDRTILFVYRQD